MCKGNSNLEDSVKLVGHVAGTKVLEQHPHHYAAKNKGNSIAADKVVFDFINPELLPDVLPDYIVPVNAIEIGGMNAIPLALAKAAATHYNCTPTNSIIQSKKVFHTKSSAIFRFISKPEFEGDVEPGKKYLLVDDVAGSGSTLNILRCYIIRNGGIVVGAITLVALKSKWGSGAELVLQKATKKKLLEIFGANEFPNFIKEYDYHEIYELSESQGSYFLEHFNSIDGIRKKIAKELGRR